MHNTLERHKFFPVIAWATVIGFALFVVNLTMNVSKQISHIEAATVVQHNTLKTE